MSDAIDGVLFSFSEHYLDIQDNRLLSELFLGRLVLGVRSLRKSERFTGSTVEYVWLKLRKNLSSVGEVISENEIFDRIERLMSASELVKSFASRPDSEKRELLKALTQAVPI